MAGRVLGNWKSFLTLAIGAAGVVVPIWLWQVDHGGKSVSVQLISQISLRPTEKDVIPGLQISIKNVPLSEPYFTVVQITNDGDKPIPSSDFESPLEIHTSMKSKIADARITEKIPKDIDAAVSWDKQVVRLKPTLMNPHDAITIAILTSGGQPDFSTKIRIIGVSAVPIIDARKPIQDPWKRWLSFLAAFIFAIPAMSIRSQIGNYSIKEKTVALRMGTANAAFFALIIGTMFSCVYFLVSSGVESFWAIYFLSVLLIMAVIVVGILLDRFSGINKSTESPKS